MEDHHIIAKYRGEEDKEKVDEDDDDVVEDIITNLETLALDEETGLGEQSTPAQGLAKETVIIQEKEDEEEAGAEEERIERAFLPAGWNARGFKDQTKKDPKIYQPKIDEKKTKVCIHHRKGRCNFGLSGKKRVAGKWEECPYLHPRVCERLLRDGDRGKGGCNGGCNKFHPKMCYASMNSRKCPQDKECRNGYHVKGTTQSVV